MGEEAWIGRSVGWCAGLRGLVLLALVAACAEGDKTAPGGASGSPVSPEDPVPAEVSGGSGAAPSSAAGGASGEGTGSAAPTSPAAQVTEPFVVDPAQSPHRVADRLVFWGWSEDGSRFAFSSYDPGEGALECEGKAELFVVDATTDTFVKGAHAAFSFGGEVETPCPEPHPHVAHDEALAASLRKQGIARGRLGTRLGLDPAGEGRWTVALPAGSGALSFTVTGDAVPADGPAGNGYRAALSRGDESLIIESGKSRRDWIWDYAPEAVFLSPDGVHAALLVRRGGMGFEGTHQTWMSNGFVLPEAMR